MCGRRRHSPRLIDLPVCLSLVFVNGIIVFHEWLDGAGNGNNRGVRWLVLELIRKKEKKEEKRERGGSVPPEMLRRSWRWRVRVSFCGTLCWQLRWSCTLWWIILLHISTKTDFDKWLQSLRSFSINCCTYLRNRDGLKTDPGDYYATCSLSHLADIWSNFQRELLCAH